MPRVYPCEHCKKTIPESDEYLVVLIKGSGGAFSRSGRVHADECWDAYLKAHPDVNYWSGDA
jgi:hypothetical protein